MAHKGLRHIKTALKVHKPALRMRMTIGGIHSIPARSKPVTRKTWVSREISRAWLFTPEPNFTRFQRNVDVLKVEQPHLDVFHEVNSIIVVAQIPGTKEKDIHIDISGDILRLEADTMTRSGQVKYYKELLLPFETDTYTPFCLISSYRNGILQLELTRDKKAENEQARKDSTVQ
ncbi:MAG: hypothetical protein AABZ62_07855 [Planctomycetota bacterium]